MNEYMLDPTKNATFEILDALFSELAEMFEGEDTVALSFVRCELGRNVRPSCCQKSHRHALRRLVRAFDLAV